METHKLMQNMAIFGAMSADALQYVIDNATQKQFVANQYLFVEGDLSNAMYVIIAGRVAIFRDWEGHRYKLRELARGDCVGEMSLLACSARSASVMAIEKTQVIEISSNFLAEFYLIYPEQYTIFVMNMAREVCRRLESADHRLFMLDRANLPTIQREKLRSEALI